MSRIKGSTLTAEHKRKISESLKGNRFAKGFKHTEETKRKVSEAGTGKKRSKETRAKMSEVAKNRTYSVETRKKLSDAAKARKYSPETRKKIGDAARGRPKSIEERRKLSIANKGQIPSPNAGRGIRTHYQSPLQGQVCFRSSWELAYAKHLDSIGEVWLYEEFQFDLGDHTYLPDFYLPRNDEFIEIKGYFSPSAKERIDTFIEEYPVKLSILRENDLIGMGVLT